jgi:prepilin-type N-terminal cleavage/methylation domain-containing protein
MNAYINAPARSARRGFTVIELMVAIMIISVGLLGMSSVMGSSSRLQTLAISRGEMATAAESKVEELRVFGGTATDSPLRVAIAVGGSIVAPVAGYSDSTEAVSGRWFYRRWQIQNGVAGTRQVTVRVVPKGPLRDLVKRLDFSSLLSVTP